MTGPLLEIDAVSVAYGKVVAVHELSLRMDAGTIVTVIGANGAGKTTLLNAVMGLLRSSGRLHFAGRNIGGLRVEERVAAGMALVPERRELFATMSVEDNLRLGGFRTGRRAIAEKLGETYRRFPRLEERRHQFAGTLSGGERQMLALGRALMSQPRLLMLDEPSLGLAPRIVRDSFRIIAELRDTGVSILLVEQNARAALAVADYGYVVERGRIVLEGEARMLAQDRRVIERYLGLGGGT
ncbi:MAG: ABC transporter ATP-binding protein [Stellaceae bacterium]